MRQKTVIGKLLQSRTEVYYKVRQVLQSATVITKHDVTPLHIFILYCRYYQDLLIYFIPLQTRKVLVKWKGNGNLQEKTYEYKFPAGKYRTDDLNLIRRIHFFKT